MDTNLTAPETPPPAIPVTEEMSVSARYLAKAREYNISLLINKYNLSETEAKTVEKHINRSTKAYLLATYGEIISRSKSRKNPTVETIATKYVEYPDFDNWYIIASAVPFFQSLGDTIGYYNGKWEFNNGNPDAGPEYVNELIYEYFDLGGINGLSIKNWLSSDDTILYYETINVLLTLPKTIDDYGKALRIAYLDALPRIENRHPGRTTIDSLEIQKAIEWDRLPYNGKSIGNGSVMRAGGIGIFFLGKHNRVKLIQLAVECSRITHNSAKAMLGSITAALFTAFSLERVSINLWPHRLMKLMKSGAIDEYLQQSRPSEYPSYVRDKVLYIGQWQSYIDFRFSGTTPKFNIPFMANPVLRYKYLKEKFSRDCDFAGGCADDCVIMAYDALLQSDGNIEKIILYSILHPGDSDTVGSVALSWFGGYYYSRNYMRLLDNYFDKLEFLQDLIDIRRKGLVVAPKLYFYDLYLTVSDRFMKEALDSIRGITGGRSSRFIEG